MTLIMEMMKMEVELMTVKVRTVNGHEDNGGGDDGVDDGSAGIGYGIDEGRWRLVLGSMMIRQQMETVGKIFLER